MQSLGKIGELPMGTPFTIKNTVCYIVVCHLDNGVTLYRRILRSSKNHDNPILHTLNSNKINDSFKRTYSVDSEKEVFDFLPF